MQINQKFFRETNGVIWENTKLIGHWSWIEKVAKKIEATFNSYGFDLASDPPSKLEMLKLNSKAQVCKKVWRWLFSSRFLEMEWIQFVIK